jgi:3-keto-L-gulonate-6-phosphate decarboxylase
MSKAMREEAQKFVNEDLIKQVFFQCGNSMPGGMYVDEVELIEYSEKLILVVGKDIAKAEREEILKILDNVNPEVAKLIRERRG